MKILVKIDNSASDFKNRYEEGCICIVIRPDARGKMQIKELWPKNTNLAQVVAAQESINLEFVGHASRSGKTLQSDATPEYPDKITVGINQIVDWIEDDLIPKDKMKNTNINLISCEAAADTNKYASLTEQMLRLFKNKPNKITSRKGFSFADTKVHSHGPIATALFVVTKGKFKLSNDTPTGEKFVFYYCENSKKYYKVDSHLHKFYLLMKKENITDPAILNIISKNFESITKQEFSTLVHFAIKQYKSGPVHKKAVLLNKGSIHTPKVLEGHIDAFQIKDGLTISIKELLATNKNCKHNKLLIEELLKATESFIAYRTVRNYNLEEFPQVLSILSKVINYQDGQFSDQDVANLNTIMKHIMKNIKKDTDERMDPTSIRPPSYYKAAKKITTEKNMKYADTISTLLKSIEPPFKHSFSLSDTEPSFYTSLNKEIFDALKGDQEIRKQVGQFPKDVQDAYHLLDQEMHNLNFIWADMNKSPSSEILQMIPTVRAMRKNIIDAKEQIIANPTEDGVKQAFSLLNAKIKNTTQTEPVLKKQNSLSQFVSSLSDKISLFVAKLTNKDRAKQMKQDLTIK